MFCESGIKYKNNAAWNLIELTDIDLMFLSKA